MNVGDRVEVLDEGLASIREIVRLATGTEPPPNHHGTVESVYDNDTVLILFDDTQSVAPYPLDEVRPLRGG